MPTTRRQQAISEGKIEPNDKPAVKKPKQSKKASTKKASVNGVADAGKKRDAEQAEEDSGPGVEEPPAKRAKTDPETKEEAQADTKAEEVGETSEKGGANENIGGTAKDEKDTEVKSEEALAKGEQSEEPELDEPDENDKGSDVYKTGTIERGHIYFFYRPRVEVEEVHDINEVRNFHMLLVPRPPAFAQRSSEPSNGDAKKNDPANEDVEMKVLQPGADAVPAPAEHTQRQHYRLVTIGKKRLPDPDKVGQRGGRMKENFWGTVTAVGDDLKALEQGLQEKEYETKTRGTRHEGAARLVARGAYAIVNTDPQVPSKRATHLGYYISHPSPEEMGEVQKALSIYTASSFVVQVKNPKAPATNPQQAHTGGADYPDWIMKDVFGSSLEGSKQSRGRQEYGLRFAPVETPELLDYKQAELLLIASKHGEDGLDVSLGDDRGKALKAEEEQEASESVKSIFDELAFDVKKFPTEPLEGEWI